MIYPVILSGGIGTRLWPVSRALGPKQLEKFFDGRSSLQLAAARTSDRDFYHAPICVCSKNNRFAIDHQIRELDITDAKLILEPVAKNTAAAIALAAHAIPDEEALVLVVSSDHFVADEKGLQDAILQAAETLKKEPGVVLFGVQPDRPETGFGYIKPNLDGSKPYKIAAFLEKPNIDDAKRYVADGYLWNSGMFLFSLSYLRREMQKHLPEVWQATTNAWQNHSTDPSFSSFQWIDEKDLADCPSISIDFGLMEKVDQAAVMPVDIGWNDIGTWKSLFDIAKQDNNGNAVDGDAMLHDCQNTHVYSHNGGHFIAGVGLKDISIIHTADATLVLPQDKSQDVRYITDFLQKHKREEASQHRLSYRSWGVRDVLWASDHFRAIRLMMNPGAQSTTQSHAKRSEHWVVVKGTATVTIGGKTFTLQQDESTFIRQGEPHRLANNTNEELHIMEIQTGKDLDDDDIVRFDSAAGDTKHFD